MQIANDRIINIHNMYNSCKDSNDINVIFNLKNAIQKRFNEKHVVIENFNLHHSSWKKSHVKANANAYELIDTMKKCKLKKITSIELITWNRHTSESTIDFIYTTSLLKNSLIETSIDENMNNHSNHRSIRQDDIEFTNESDRVEKHENLKEDKCWYFSQEIESKIIE